MFVLLPGSVLKVTQWYSMSTRANLHHTAWYLIDPGQGGAVMNTDTLRLYWRIIWAYARSLQTTACLTTGVRFQQYNVATAEPIGDVLYNDLPHTGAQPGPTLPPQDVVNTMRVAGGRRARSRGRWFLSGLPTGWTEHGRVTDERWPFVRDYCREVAVRTLVSGTGFAVWARPCLPAFDLNPIGGAIVSFTPSRVVEAVPRQLLAAQHIRQGLALRRQ